MNVRTTVSVIGTAGRGQTATALSADSFQYMKEETERVIASLGFTFSTIELVSGGAAWADHVAVALFLEHETHGAKLTLHLPCPWDSKLGQFQDTGISNWKMNPGRTANQYHHQFSRKVRMNSLEGLNRLQTHPRVTYRSYSGFHERNSVVARSSFLIAFTLDKVPTGGTKDTWDKCTSPKIHYNLAIRAVTLNSLPQRTVVMDHLSKKVSTSAASHSDAIPQLQDMLCFTEEQLAAFDTLSDEDWQ